MLTSAMEVVQLPRKAARSSGVLGPGTAAGTGPV